MIEVMIAASIITAFVVTAVAVAQRSIYVSRQAFHTTQVGFLLEEGAEAVRIVRDNGWSNISLLTNGTTYYPTWNGTTWTLSTISNTWGIFTRTVVVASVNRDNTTKDITPSGGTTDSGTRLITVTVSWQEGGTTITKTLPFYISDIL